MGANFERWCGNQYWKVFRKRDGATCVTDTSGNSPGLPPYGGNFAVLHGIFPAGLRIDGLADPALCTCKDNVRQ